MINHGVRDTLIKVAKKEGKYERGVITYSELNDDCNLGINFEGDAGGVEIGEILGELSADELTHGKPPLSVLVGLKNVKPFTPSSGFFNLMDRLNVRKEGETDEQRKSRCLTG